MPETTAELPFAKALGEIDQTALILNVMVA
jgi:hypothetical protein